MMHITVNERYQRAFRQLLAEERIGDPAVFMDVDVFDEVPVYSRFQELGFLSPLPYVEANEVLIKSTALYLDRIVSYASRQAPVPGKTILRMVSVTGWQHEDESRRMNYDGSFDFLRPNIWLGNFANPKLNNLRFWPVGSPAGSFVKSAINDDHRFRVLEGRPDKFGGPSPDRVYIYIPGSEGSDRIRMDPNSS
jgi:hypothetical protein